MTSSVRDQRSVWSVRALQVFVCSGYDLCHPGLHPDIHIDRQTDGMGSANVKVIQS